MANCKAIRIPKSWAYYMTKAMKKIACYAKPQTPCVNLEKDSTMDCDSQLEQNTEKKEQIMDGGCFRKEKWRQQLLDLFNIKRFGGLTPMTCYLAMETTRSMFW